MSSYVQLIGAEEVSRAAGRMQEAAREISMAASTISEAVRQHGFMVHEFAAAADRLATSIERLEERRLHAVSVL